MGKINISSIVASGFNKPKITIKDNRLGNIPKKGVLKPATLLKHSPHNAPPSADV